MPSSRAIPAPGWSPRLSHLLSLQAGSCPLRHLAWLPGLSREGPLAVAHGLQSTCLAAPQHLGAKLPNQGFEPCSPRCKADSQPLNQQGSPWKWAFKEVTRLLGVTMEGPELV